LTEKVAEVAAAAIVTLAGTVAADVLLLASLTTTPPVAAGPLMVAVPVEVAPPTTEVGFKVTDERVGALTVSVAVLETDPSFAVIVAVTFAAIAMVLTVKVLEALPEATVTDAGTVADVVLLVRLTTVPADGAAPVRVTVPVDELPPMTVVGESVREDNASGLTVSVAV
jgi:hypothetical protein